MRQDAERWQALQLMWKADVIAGLDENSRPLRARHAGPWGLTERVDAKRAALASKAPPKLMASDVWEIGKQVWPFGGPTLVEQSKFADLIERKLERIAAQSPAPTSEAKE